MNKTICPNTGSYAGCETCPHGKPHINEGNIWCHPSGYEKKLRGKGFRFSLCYNSECGSIFEYYMKEIIKEHEESK